MGARGAAWASVIGEIMVSATCVYYVYKLKLYSISWRCLKKSCCASFIFPLVYVCMFLGSMEKNFLWFILYSFIAWVGYILIQCKLKNSVCMYIFSTITKYV
jgi:Na+-driven multidrug efflux pump